MEDTFTLKIYSQQVNKKTLGKGARIQAYRELNKVYSRKIRQKGLFYEWKASYI